MISIDYKAKGEKLLRINVEFEDIDKKKNNKITLKTNDEIRGENKSAISKANEKNKRDKRIIKRIIITGDFFAYPEDVIMNIEKELAGNNVKKETIIKIINDILEKEKAKLIGLSPDTIAESIIKAEMIREEKVK